MRGIFYVLLMALCACTTARTSEGFQPDILFNDGWQFQRLPDGESALSAINEQAWEQVSLPHTAKQEPMVITGKQWQGNAVYHKTFHLPKVSTKEIINLHFEGAMQTADVYLNGQHLAQHKGGYLPFDVVLNPALKYGAANELLVMVNNEDDASIAPGKPIADLDFNIFSGIYRNVWLQIKKPVHITSPLHSGVAKGGLFVTFPEVTAQQATVSTQVELENSANESAEVSLETVLSHEGKVVSRNSKKLQVKAGDKPTSVLKMQVEKPMLWSPDAPNLYQLTVLVRNAKGQVLDRQETKVGIRTFEINKDGVLLNGKLVRLRGTNRHQSYPYIGYAISDNANYRDAYKIKAAGFNFVRLSHYPQTTSFLKACDELGLIVMDCIPGWQFFGDAEFEKNTINDVRQMVRRDRNHPSVMIWEASLNESGMTEAFMKKAHQAVHQEFPGDHVYTSGWLEGIYDIYCPARQHAKAPDYWKKYDGSSPILIAEYGDWEYYAQNAGFNQKAYSDLSAEERTSRQLRSDGQTRLQQQAMNFQEAHNDNLYGRAVGDANWLMFDYNRGYAPDLESSGIMDICRLPKLAFYFYQSQHNILKNRDQQLYGPMIKIGTYLTDPTERQIKIYSNCEVVELFEGSHSLGKQYPTKNAVANQLEHAPFIFTVSQYPSTLRAVGMVDGKVVCEDVVNRPTVASKLKLEVDQQGKALEAGVNDVVFVHAYLTDARGTTNVHSSKTIQFKVSGDAQIIGDNPVKAEAGIASVLLRAGSKGGIIKITAECKGLAPTTIEVTPK